MASRRTIRDFSPRSVDPELIERAVVTAASAPSGANRQPWRFVVVTDPEMRRRIREGAEDEERAFYSGPHDEWHEALAPLGTDWRKSMITDAPMLIAVFEVHKGRESRSPTTRRSRSGSRWGSCSRRCISRGSRPSPILRARCGS
jgi:nitroreductase